MIDMTPIEEVYESFLVKINDYTLAKYSEDIAEDLMANYLKKSIASFYKCVKPLNIIVNREEVRTPVLDEKGFPIMDRDGFPVVDISYIEHKNFQYELTDFEIDVLSDYMIVYHYKPIVQSGELFRQSLSDSGYNIYSQGNHLRELRLYYSYIKSSVEKKITEYTFAGTMGFGRQLYGEGWEKGYGE